MIEDGMWWNRFRWWRSNIDFLFSARIKSMFQIVTAEHYIIASVPQIKNLYRNQGEKVFT